MEYWERETSFIIPPIDRSKYNPLKKRKKKAKKKMANKIDSDLTKHNYNNAQDSPHSLESTEVGERNLGNENPPEQLDVKDPPNEDVLQPPSSEMNENIPPHQTRPVAPYQLVFGMDDASSETSITSSPRSVESSNPLLSYVPASHDELLPPIPSELSEDVSSESLDVSSVSRDTVIETQQPTAPEHLVDTGSDTTLALDSSSLTLGEEDVSVYSASTVVADSTKELKSDEDYEKHDQMEEEMKSQSSGEVKLEDIRLQSRSASATPPPRMKLHPISTNTGDSDPPLSPPYSPIEYVPDEDETEFGNIAILPPSPLPPGIDSPVPLDDQPSMSILFSGVTYLGSSSVDAPISETEANRKMIILKQQASASEPIPIVLSIPTSNDGTVYLKDPETDHPLTTFPVRMILFCARGNTENYFDCFCLNVRHKRSGIYHCHVFRCEIIEACHKIFEAIGKAFKTKPLDATSPELTSELTCEFDVTFEIREDDGKGNYVLVPMDKDSFKLRQNTRKKVVLSVAQPTTAKPMVVERCFGLLISPGKDVKQSEMNLLDNMNCSTTDGIFTVAGFWDVGVPFLTPLNEETSKSARHRHMTIAADLVLEGVTEPVRFKRELKIQVSKGDSLGYFVSTLSKRKHPTETFILTLRRSLESTTKNMMYSIVELKNAREVKAPPPQSNSSQSPASPGEGGQEKDAKPQLIPAEEVDSSPSVGARKQGKAEHNGDSDNSQAVDEYEEEYLVSGWGEMDDMREDLLKDWGELLDKWDGKEKTRPKQLIKLCRKGIPRHLRCQVWQLLSGAAYDPQLYESYRLLISKESPTENVINWDIKRTYVGHEYFKDGLAKDALYKINKAYSVYDEEVGYCQGFSFMVAVLLLQKMPEEQAFSVLVKIMYNYGHRDVFRNDFRNLHLMFYQLDRLMEEHLSDLHQHFQAERVETHMFASQWFLTLYTAKFPLVVVFRILDNFLCERTPVLFQVALGLLKLARKDLMALDFEGILNYFRVSLPRKFQSEEDCKHLFHTVFHFKIKDSKLKKLEKDYQFHLEQVAQEEDPVNRFQRENKQLRDTIIRLEQENDNLAQELVTSKVTLRAEMDKLEERIDTLSKEARARKTNTEVAQQQISELKEEVQQAKEEYQKVMMQLMEDRLHHEGAISEYKELFQRLDQGHQKQKEELNQELIEVKAQLGSLGEVPADADSAQHLSSLSSEQRLRNLELELAQTKLALVESQCKNQELEHKVEGVTSGQVQSKGRNWFDFSKKK